MDKTTSHDVITLTDSNETKIDITPLQSDQYPANLVVKITVTSGGPIKFNSLGPADASNLSVANGESITLTLVNKSWFYAKGANNDTFKYEL